MERGGRGKKEGAGMRKTVMVTTGNRKLRMGEMGKDTNGKKGG